MRIRTFCWDRGRIVNNILIPSMFVPRIKLKQPQQIVKYFFLLTALLADTEA